MTIDISIIIPTYNSAKTLPMCLNSIVEQEYYGDIELIIVDAGSTDNSIEIAKLYTKYIYNNPLKTGEAGKAIGIKYAKGNIIALIDSDNILPEKDWLNKMMSPFADKDIAATEPLYYTYRAADGYITRYCSLIGMNDPFCLFVGNYDRMNFITGRWTDMPIKENDVGNYLKVELDEKNLPTIGANGFMIRRDLLKNCSIDDFLFDIDVVYELVKKGHNIFAKVKIGIVHIFSGNIKIFIKKQMRRIKDYNYYRTRGLRKYPWVKFSKIKLLKFILFTVLIIPLIIQSIKGWLRFKDNAWILHVPMCWITLIIYTYGTIKTLFNVEIENRDIW